MGFLAPKLLTYRDDETGSLLVRRHRWVAYGDILVVHLFQKTNVDEFVDIHCVIPSVAQR